MEVQNNNTPRSAKVIIIVGFNGTGKTTITKQFVDVEVTRRKGRVLILVPDPIEWKEFPELDLSAPDCFHKMQSPHKIVVDENTLARIADPHSGFFNGLMIFDDCRGYFSTTVQKDLHTLIVRRRQRRHDIIAVGHGFTEIPPKFFTFANEYIIFYTQDPIEKRKDDIGSPFEKIKNAVTDVNSHYITNPHYYKIIKAN